MAVGNPLRWLGGQIDIRVEVDTPFLDQAMFGIWDTSTWGSATWGARDPAWADISHFVRQVTIDQGKERWEQRFGAGTATVVVDNTSGIFTPDTDLPTPWYLPWRPGRRIRIVAIPDGSADPRDPDAKVPLFTGTIDAAIDQFSDAGFGVETHIQCVDFMVQWAGHDPVALETPTGVQRTDERVNAALDRLGWPEDLRDIQEGLHTMQSSFLAQSTAEECHRAAEAEGGAFFCSKDGKATFKARDWLRGGPSEGDQVTETFSTPGTYTWTCPPDVYVVQVELWGGGGGGGAAHPVSSIGYPMGGGGGGGYSRSVVNVTPGTQYTVVVGKGGAGGDGSAYIYNDPAYMGEDGGDSEFYGPGLTKRRAGGGQRGGPSGGAGGDGYGDTVHQGGRGGARYTGDDGGGGGGGSSGSPNGPGVNGKNGGVTTGGAGGTITNGGNGGNGGNDSQTLAQNQGKPGQAPGGGGGGAGRCALPGTPGDGGAGANGRVVLTYTPTLAPTDPRSIQVQGYIGYDASDAPAATLTEGDRLPIPWDIRWDTSGSNAGSYFWGGAHSPDQMEWRTWDVDNGSLEVYSSDGFLTIGTYDPEEHRWMRITNNGTTIRWFTAPDFSGPWTEHYSEPAPADVDDWEVAELSLALPVFYRVVTYAPALSYRTSWELARIRNDIQLARVGGTVIQRSDSNSITLYQRRTYRRLDYQNAQDSELEILAERFLAGWKDNRMRVDAVTIAANSDPNNENLNRLFWDTQFGDLLQIKVKSPHGWSYERQSHVIGISHVITPDDWVVTFRLDDSAVSQQE